MQAGQGEDVQAIETYPEDYGAAAVRHWHDAEVLKQKAAFANSGYHYGFAAECAVKRRFRVEQPLTQSVPHEHIACPTARRAGEKPAKDFRQTALLRLSGRRSGVLIGLLRNHEYFRGWAIEMRYSRGDSVDETICTNWRKDALLTLRATEIRW